MGTGNAGGIDVPGAAAYVMMKLYEIPQPSRQNRPRRSNEYAY